MKDVREALMIGRNSEGKLVRRPVSPFMLGSAYKFQISSLTSILHRISGCVLAVGTLLFTLWLVTAASGAEVFAGLEAFLVSWIGLIILIGFTLALCYHFCNGIRHLAWDAGKGFEKHTSHRTGVIVFIAAALMTLAFWLIAFFWVW